MKPIVGFVASAFDLLHVGHILLLEDCKTICDYLIVGLHIDPSIERSFKNKPIQSLDERTLQLRATKYVDKIIWYSRESEIVKILKKHKPDIRILGSDYKNKKYTCEDLGIEIYYHNRNHSYSSSELRNRIFEIEKLSKNEK